MTQHTQTACGTDRRTRAGRAKRSGARIARVSAAHDAVSSCSVRAQRPAAAQAKGERRERMRGEWAGDPAPAPKVKAPRPRC
eukprot:912987-Rhodomonas_salina.2